MRLWVLTDAFHSALLAILFLPWPLGALSEGGPQLYYNIFLFQAY